MICKRCGNEDDNYFYYGSKGIYCRKCVSFKRMGIVDELRPYEYEVDNTINDYHLNFELSKYQKEASDKLKEIIKDKDVLLYCVCGAGKTEIVLDTIKEYLGSGKKVCYAISRKEVVKELSIRFQRYFINAKVISVYGKHHDELSGDLIIATCHQLYRYYKTFDLLIIDEVDAFPLNNNKTLMNISLNSSKGRVIFSTATINPFLKDILKERDYETIRLLFRPSLKPLIEPKVYYGMMIYLLIKLFIIIKKQNKQILVFLEKKRECIILSNLFKMLFRCRYVYSDLKNRDYIIKDFRDKKIDILFTTILLERGITIDGINVIVVNHNNYFDCANYIQMIGRVGRSFKDPYGEAYILSKGKNKEIDNCIRDLKEANHELSLL